MSHKILTFLVAALCLSVALPVMAQESAQPKTFHLLREDQLARKAQEQEQEQAEAWVPRLEEGQMEISFALGMLDLNQTILKQDQVIYKYTDESTFWGDIDIKGANAFNPVLRVGYSVYRWLTLEGIGGLSFATYSTSITNRHSRKNEAGALVVDNPPLGEFDAEARSLITVQLGASAMIYPFDIHGEGGGRWHPYLTAGFGRVWYDMNSNYNTGSTGANDLNFGGGIRLLADRTISIRIEALLHRNTLQWEPVKNFLSLNEGTLLVPLEEFPVNPDGSFEELPITSFESRDMNVLNLSIGFQGTF